jgi:hypothetical protein
MEHAGWTYNADGSVRSGFEERADLFSTVAFWYQQGVQEGLPEIPYGAGRLPFGNAMQIAVEDSLADVTTENGKVSVQREVDWAKDLLFLEAKGAGAKINIPIDIAEAGQELIANRIVVDRKAGRVDEIQPGKADQTQKDAQPQTPAKVKPAR